MASLLHFESESNNCLYKFVRNVAVDEEMVGVEESVVGDTVKVPKISFTRNVRRMSHTASSFYR